MRKFITALLVLVLSFFTACDNSTADTEAEAQPSAEERDDNPEPTGTETEPQQGSEQMNTLTMAVTGMTCGGCSGRIEDNLGELDGVENVDASHDEDRVVIEHSGDIDETAFAEQMATEIESLGFIPEPQQE